MEFYTNKFIVLDNRGFYYCKKRGKCSNQTVWTKDVCDARLFENPKSAIESARRFGKDFKILVFKCTFELKNEITVENKIQIKEQEVF